MERLLQFRKDNSALTPAQLRARIGADMAFRTEIETLYGTYFPTYPKLNKSCGNCWEDAAIIILSTRIETIMEKKEQKYILKAGALLRDVDAGTLDTRHTLTDEKALAYLAQDPNHAGKFEKLPADWKKQAEEYRKASSKSASEGARETGRKGAKDKSQATGKEAKKALSASDGASSKSA